jgi:predicted NBD/HSP70 family sugar kinase
MKTTGDQQLVKRINRSVLLRLIRSEPGLSRARLALKSGLTKSTVSTAVRELLEEGWLTEDSISAASGQGRPSTPLQINANARGLVGVEVAVDCLRVASVSLLGEVLWSHEEPLQNPRPEAVCAQVAKLVVRAQAQLARRGFLLSGVGLGLPGAFEEATGILRFAPNLGWRNLVLAPLMAQAFVDAGLPDVPVHIQNEADAAALSEYEFAHKENSDALIFVTCDVGVGAGIVLDDRLYTGSQGLAGEIGHTILQLDGPLCSCGRKGCAETFIGARALGEELRVTGKLGVAGRYLGVLIQNLWTSFNPAVLVVGGRSCVRHPGLVAIAQRTLQDFAASAGMPPPVVRPASYGLLAAAVGAAAMVLHRYMRPIQTGSQTSSRTRAQPRARPTSQPRARQTIAMAAGRVAPLQSAKKMRQPALA